MSPPNPRLSTELSLLESMYPDNQISYNPKTTELHYTFPESKGSFTLRIPESYLSDEMSKPEVLSASSSTSKTDLRNQLKDVIATLPAGEEILDSIISGFEDLLATSPQEPPTQPDVPSEPSPPSSAKATVIVYLHHLLATSKRKHALSPSSPTISGVTKPGYPGVLIYSGPAREVWEHVNELKGLNWQAFQIRLESSEEWKFKHGEGIIEVEGMGDVVAEIDVQEGRKEVFMECMRMK